MATNKVQDPGYCLTVVATHPTTPDSGAPVRLGTLTGVATGDEDADGDTVVDFGPGVWDLTVDDDLGTGIAIGDALYYHDTGTGTGSVNVNNKPAGAQAFFGYALEAVTANATSEIKVLHPAPSRNGKTEQTIVAGAAAGNVTVTGITMKDELVSVIKMDFTDASEAAADLTSEFSITAADTINNAAGTSSSGGFLLVTYIDRTLG